MNKIRTGILTGTIALTTLSGCKREPIHLLENNSNKIIERVDSFTKSKLNQPDTAGLTRFMTDTVKITNKNLDKPEEFMNNVLQKAWRLVPEKTVDTSLKYGYTVGPHMNMSGEFKFGPGMGLHNEDVTEPLYLRKTLKTIVQNKVYATPDNKDFYVPVDYYGKTNPIFTTKDSIK